MLSAREVNTSVRPMTSFQIGCLGLTQKAGVGVFALNISLWQSTSRKNAKAGCVHKWAFHQSIILHFPSQENSTVVATVVCPRRFWAVQM